MRLFNLPPVPDGASRLERAGAGCLLGIAAGDALGLVCEGLAPARQAKLFPSLAQPGLLFGKGMCSDDTEHACMTAQAMLGANGDPAKLARALGAKLRWWLCGLPAGIGMATLRSCVKLWLGVPATRSGVVSAGNGPAMRAPLIGVCHGADPERMRQLVLASTRVTHRDPRAEDGALAVALAAHLAASHDGPVAPEAYCAALATLVGAESDTVQALRAAAASAARAEPAAAFAATLGCARGVSGYMLHTVPVVVQIWLRRQDDFRGGIEEIIRLGGDTDTTAAILGGILGARAGQAGIPPAWIGNVLEWPRTPAFIAALGARTARAAELRVAEPELPLFVPAIVPRNMLFMAVVLSHGVRRMLPPY